MIELIKVADMASKATVSSCNHVYVVDVSGSMYGSLPEVRNNLKNAITSSMKDGDTLTVIYFSGKGQTGTVFEKLKIDSIDAITKVQSAIDRWLVPVGLTSFVDPIELAMSIQFEPGTVNSFIMMTDGADNANTRQSIMNSVEKLKDKFSYINFIEYGYYADRNMIAEMAKAVDGGHLFAENTLDYREVVCNTVAATVRVPEVEVKANKQAKDVVYEYNGALRITPVVNGVAKVPADVPHVHSIVPKDVLSKQLSEDRLYMILYYASVRNLDYLVCNVLNELGDAFLIRKYANAFTKMEMSDFAKAVEKAAINPDSRSIEGTDKGLFDKLKNAKTVVDLLDKLSEVEANLVLSSPDWKYNRTGRARESSDEKPKFVQSALQSVTMRGLVMSTERPNINISTTIGGFVDLPENEYGLSRVPSFITRNYTIVRDGIMNVDVLPVIFPSEHEDFFKEFPHDVVESSGGKSHWNFKLRDIPVVTRSKVQSVGEDEFVEMNCNLIRMKADLKVLNSLSVEENKAAKSASLIAQYGEEAAKWLHSIGVRDYGFSPVGTKSSEATDEYESVRVEVKFKGASSLPAIDAVNKKISEKKKLNFGDSLIASSMKKYGKLTGEQALSEKSGITKLKRELERDLSKAVYALILGRKWFCDEEVFSKEIDIDGSTTTMTAEKVRKMEAI